MNTVSKTSRMIGKYFTKDKHPYDLVEWKKFNARIGDYRSGKTFFEQNDVEFPEFYSQNAVNIIVSKYFKGIIGSPNRETSYRQLLDRVINTNVDWGKKQGYFETDEDANIYSLELTHILLHQKAYFNSPVWFNMGFHGRPQQASACLPYSSRVNTNKGMIPIGEIYRGFRTRKGNFDISTWDKDGNPTKITKAICNGKKTVMKYKLSDGSCIRLTSDHVVFVTDEDGNFLEKKIKDIKLNKDKLHFHRGILLSEDTPGHFGLFEIDIDLAWLCGVLVGDGYADRPYSSTSDIWEVKINTDKELDKVLRVCEKYDLKNSIITKHWGYIIRGYGESVSGFWKSLGLWGNAGEKIIPEWVFRSPSIMVCSFLSGLYDADGFVSNRESYSKYNANGVIGLGNTSEQVVLGTQMLLRSMGIRAGLLEYEDPREGNVRKLFYNLKIYEKVSIEIFREMMSLTHEKKNKVILSLRVDYKNSNHNKIMENFLFVTEVSRGGPELVFDIQTDSGSFWNEGILVHNCFINKVEDDSEAILDLLKTEGLIFRGGSGSGMNVSALRSKFENLSTGGTSSGALSFMRGFDYNAGIWKSGGATRRAAKMVIMNIDHPEIVDFIGCKVKEEEKAFALIREGYDSSYNGSAYETVAFQNANHSVRVGDEFMEAVESDGNFWTKEVVSGKRYKKYKAKELMRQIAEATHKSGDPGLQFHDLINEMNTCKEEECDSTNPCSEYVSQSDTSCNLSSINLMTFFNPETGVFDCEGFYFTCRIMSMAKDIWINLAHYPTEKLAEKTKQYRTIGLGYSNLGALIMALGLPYDSDDGRSLASAITSLMTAAAYETSTDLCGPDGLEPFPMWEKNKKSMMDVLSIHRDSTKKISKTDDNTDILKKANALWMKILKVGLECGFRNSYTTNIAPTGTISFAMDCDTTGPEPELALVKEKLLSGSDVKILLVNGIVQLALKRLGYKNASIEKIVEFIEKNGHVEGSGVKKNHLPVFDCSLGTSKRSIHYMGHLKMLKAIQPFISGGISKTINLPESASVDDIMDAYMSAWKMGIKCVAIYRNNSKGSQPLSTIKEKRSRATRIKLPDDVDSKRHKFSISGHEGYITIGRYEDGSPGEVFITMSKGGSTIRGLVDTIGVMMSMLFQYGIPVKILVNKFMNTRFEPHGMTMNKKIRSTSSVVDYIVRHLANECLSENERTSLGMVNMNGNGTSESNVESVPVTINWDNIRSEGEICFQCGMMMTRNGTCKVCPRCGETTGCG